MLAHIDPTTRALETYIDASVEQLLQGNTGTPQNGLLFLSAWHEAMPALVHLDPVLDPVDSRVFAVLWIWAKQQGRGSTAFPSYDYLLQRCNIQSRATVARSLAILRITRWVTLCRRVRDQGRIAATSTRCTTSRWRSPAPCTSIPVTWSSCRTHSATTMTMSGRSRRRCSKACRNPSTRGKMCSPPRRCPRRTGDWRPWRPSRDEGSGNYFWLARQHGASINAEAGGTYQAFKTDRQFKN